MSRSRSRSRKRPRKKHGSRLENMLEQQVDLLSFLTNYEATSLLTGNRKFQKQRLSQPKIHRRLQESKCWVTTGQGQKCILQSQRVGLRIQNECVLFCENHYFNALRIILSMFFR
jgi:hypothetical protein